MILPIKIEFQKGCTNVKMEGKRPLPNKTCLAMSFAIPLTKHRLGMAAIHKQWKEKFGVANSILIHCSALAIAILNTARSQTYIRPSRCAAGKNDIILVDFEKPWFSYSNQRERNGRQL